MKDTGSGLWKPVQCGSQEECCCGEFDGLVVVNMESFETHLELARCDLLPAIGSSFNNFFEVILY